MKKKLLLLVLSIALVQFANSQVIELIGIGVENVNPSTLYISDPGTVDHVVVEAAAVFRGTTPVDVTFSDVNESYTVSFNLAEQDFAPTVPNGVTQNWGYYTATFSDVDASGITLENYNQLENVISFTAYIYRTGGDPYVYSMIEYDHAFVFHNSSADPLIYNFTLPWSMEPRDINIKIPISELTEDGRHVVISLDAGGTSTVLDFDSNNLGDLLNIQSIMLANVAGDLTNITLEIYSPTEAIDGENGDSFITGAILLTTTVNQGCTYTQGYWKTHSEYGPASKPDATWDELPNGPDSEFYLSGMSWIDVFNTPVGGNAYFKLAHQFMAAYLNTLKGIYVPAEVENALTDATAIFEVNEPAYYEKVKGKSEASQTEIKELTDLASILADYNEGRIGPGHCEDEDMYMEKSAAISTNEGLIKSGELLVYPNPVKGKATISFNPEFTGNLTIDLYNSTGQKVTRLFDKTVHQNINETMNFESSRYNEGLYLLVIQNESNRQTKKIIINR
ncbi:T9SS type A sorting domain-containing protein [Prolixibacteraceae bacterium Z1-6]|uniref:T9SS type A sorting domain-containing protein n=1 Tax=Draconibacterium aestuarii TaxID=2998507 RepID=A0A9X3FBE3_9BACT|nr:T9SS type A sorting domain-containing protein [Prolixibacteraceae bacterium Z1-6]